jgi:hypothetical protein
VVVRRISTRARAARARRLRAAGVLPPSGEAGLTLSAYHEAAALSGDHKIGRQQFRALDRETKLAVGGFTLIALVFEPIETLFSLLFGWLFDRDEEEDEEPAPDYSRAERIPEDYR